LPSGSVPPSSGARFYTPPITIVPHRRPFIVTPRRLIGLNVIVGRFDASGSRRNMIGSGFPDTTAARGVGFRGAGKNAWFTPGIGRKGAIACGKDKTGNRPRSGCITTQGLPEGLGVLRQPFYFLGAIQIKYNHCTGGKDRLKCLEQQQRAHSPQVLPDGSASRVGAKRKSCLAGQRGGFNSVSMNGYGLKFFNHFNG